LPIVYRHDQRCNLDMEAGDPAFRSCAIGCCNSYLAYHPD
jgi:hypothetical protein